MSDQTRKTDDKFKEALGPLKGKVGSAPRKTETNVSEGVGQEVNAINDLLGKKIVIQKRKRKMQWNLCHACGYLGHTAKPEWHDEDTLIVDQWGTLSQGGKHKVQDYPVDPRANVERIVYKREKE